MSARAVITMSPEQYLAGLKQLEAATNKSASKMENSFKEYGTSINKAGIAMRYVSSEMGAGAVAFGRAFQVLAGGKIAIAVAAITSAIVALRNAWDKLTLSESEYQQKQDRAIQQGEKNLSTLRQTQSEEDGMIDRLRELAERENKTNEEKEESIRLAQILGERYAGLGINVNNLTADFEGLNEEIKKIKNVQREARLEALADQISNLSLKSDALVRKEFKGNWWTQSADFVSSLFGGKDGGKYAADQYKALSFEDRLKKAQYMYSEVARTDEELRFWDDEINRLNQIIELQKRMDNLKKTGYETDKEQLAAKQAQSEESRKAQDAEEAAWKARVAVLDEEARKQEELDRKHGEALQKELEKEQQIVAERKKGAELRRTNDIASLRGMALRALGKDEQADIEDAIYAETQAQGVPLDAATKSEISARVKARRALQSAMQTSTSPGLYAPRVDALIARGGSATPVNMPKLEGIQTKQLDAQNKTNQIANRILNQMDKWNTI